MQYIPTLKGVYQPPSRNQFPNLKMRYIKISSYIDKRISHFIGKDGRHFIDWTNEYDLLYIFYRDRKIEIWGENEENIHKLIHLLIEKIKTLNQKKIEKTEEGV
jgi:hypothetical protein